MPEYNSKVYVNGVEIKDWTQWRVYQQLGLAEKRFTVGFERAVDIADGSTATIKEGYGNTLLTLINEKAIEDQEIETSFTNERARIGGAQSDVSIKASTKYIWYVNKEWLDSIYANYVIQDDVIYRSDPGRTPYRIQGVSINRLFLPYLPPRNIRDAELLCIVQSGWTQHSIARDLAQRIGYSIRIGVPDLDLQKVFVLRSNAPYFQGIAALFSKWNPFIYIEDKVIYVKDYSGSRQSRPTGSGLLSLSEDSFEVLRWRRENPTNVADHILVQGPSESFTYKRRERPQTNKIARSESSLSGSTRVLVYEDTLEYDVEVLKEISDTLDQDIYSEYSNTLLKPTKTITTMTQKVSLDEEQVAVIQEEKVEYLGDIVMHKVITDYRYADYTTPLGTTVTEWSRRPKIKAGVTANTQGTYVSYDPNEWVLELISVIKSDVWEYVGQTGLVETDVYHYNLLQYTEGKTRIQGTTYDVRSGVKPVHWADQIGEPAHEENSGFSTIFGLQKVEKVRYDDISDDMIRKIRTVCNLFPIVSVKTQSEMIPIKRNKNYRNIVERRWEYFKVGNSLTLLEDGQQHPTGTFHPTINITDMDLIEERDAREIAYRQMAKYPATKTGGSIKLVRSVPNLKIGMSVIIPECTKKFFNYDTDSWDDVTIDAGTYWIVRHTKVARYSGAAESTQRMLECYDELEVSDHY